MTQRTLVYRTLLLWVLFEAFAATQVRGPSGATVLASWARALFTPPVTLIERLAGTTGDLITGFGDSRTLASENRRLTEVAATLKSQNATLRTDLQATLQAAESLRSLPVFSGTPARCLYRDLGRGLLLVSIGAARPTVDHDTPVLGEGGVIGRVIRVEGQVCWIESLTRSSAAIAVTTLDGVTQGMAEGTGRSELDIRFVPLRAPLTVGQELVTSGADGIYPPGFPVARISSIHERGGPFLEVKAHPVANPITVQSVWLVDDGRMVEGHGQEEP